MELSSPEIPFKLSKIVTNGVPFIAGSNATEGSYYTKSSKANDHFKPAESLLGHGYAVWQDPDAYFDALEGAYPQRLGDRDDLDRYVSSHSDQGCGNVDGLWRRRLVVSV